jgi:hypothetical protein
MINIETVKRFISTNDISFLTDFDKTIDINKSGRCNFHKMFRLEQESIKDFIFKNRKW